MVEYKYHSQLQAEEFARGILAVPGDYPLRAGLDEGFRDGFAALCGLVKRIYLDMAKEPEEYGIMLLDITQAERNAVRDSYRTIHKLCDTLNALFLPGTLENGALRVEAAAFRAAAKKAPKYQAVLKKLLSFGFVIGGFDGKAIEKKAAMLSVEYPQDSRIITTLKAYCDIFSVIRNDRKNVKLNPEEFHHHFYRFDYKITADMTAIPMSVWVRDEAEYYGLSGESARFYTEFYDRSLAYPKLKFNGDYFVGSKRVARVLPHGNGGTLVIKQSRMDGYADVICALPAHVKQVYTRSNCGHCGFQGATDEHCKFRLHWTLGGTAHEGCAFSCFNFEGPKVEDMDFYFTIIEREYNIKKCV